MLGKLTLGCFFLLLVWGNLVAGMKAGLGCPDWPLCHGRVFPPYRWDIYMEFGHRVIAAISTVLLLILSHIRFRAYKGKAKAVPLMAVALVGAAILLGGFVVLLELPVQLTTIHFMIGLSVFMLVYYMATFDGMSRTAGFSLGGNAGLFIAFGAVVFFQAALGSYVRHSGSGLACPDFPTCLGRMIPPSLDMHVLAHFSHRALAYLIALTVAVLYASTILDERIKGSRRAVFLLLLLVVGQVSVGALVVLTGLYYMATALHLAVALAMLYVIGNMWAGEIRTEGTAA